MELPFKQIRRDGAVVTGVRRHLEFTLGFLAAKKLEIKEVPTICLENLTDDQIRAYIIADNKIAENAGWDRGSHAMMSEEEGLYRLRKLWAGWNYLTEMQKYKIAQQIIDRIIIFKDNTNIRLDYTGINAVLTNLDISVSEPTDKTPDILHEPKVMLLDNTLEITINIIFKVKGRIKQAFNTDGQAFEIFKKSKYDMTLINALGKAYKWNQKIKYERKRIEDIVAEDNVSKS